MKLQKLSAANRKGQGLVEYALILTLIAIVVVVIVALLGGQINRTFALIIVNMKYPGTYNGPPVTVTSVSVNVSCVTEDDCTATANVGLQGAQGSPDVCVQFSGGGVACGNPPSAPVGSQSASACVIAVDGHSLGGGSVCSN